MKGLFFSMPLLLTLYAFIWIFSKIDGLLRNFFGIEIPGLGLVVAILLMTCIGFLSTNIFARGIMNFIDLVFRNTPFVKLVYKSIGDLINAFVGKKRVFDKPVMVTIFAGSEGKALGFITAQDLTHLDIRDHVVVYFPQSYNFAGQTLIFPKDKVKPIQNIASSELMTFIVSAGIAGRHDLLEHPNASS